MAATVSAWGKAAGDWALDAEREDAERAALAAAAPQPAEAEFPSLSAAASAKPARKKKPQAVSLAEFTTGKAVTYSAAKAHARADEVIALPTGPRERSAEELEQARFGRGFGGGFSERRGGFGGGDESRWGSNRGEEPPRRNDMGPSRADEVDDWGAGKKFALMGSERERRNDLGPSRADEVDDWGAGKKVAPLGGERRDRGGFFDSHSRADESGSWVSNKTQVMPPSESRPRRGGFEFQKEPASNGDADSAESWGRKREEPSRGGRPKLVLQPRTVPIGNGEAANANSKPKGSSPFGDARPREEVLAEKGQDWKKIDEQLESIKIKETEPLIDGSSFGRKGLGRSGPAEERTERSWRKPEPEPEPEPEPVEISPRTDAVEIAEGVAAN